jgi:hypothetical protein
MVRVELERNRMSDKTDPVIAVYKRAIDRSLLRENLKRSVEERFRNLMELQRFAEELRRAGRQSTSES